MSVVSYYATTTPYVATASELLSSIPAIAYRVTAAATSAVRNGNIRLPFLMGGKAAYLSQRVWLRNSTALKASRLIAIGAYIAPISAVAYALSIGSTRHKAGLVQSIASAAEYAFQAAELVSDGAQSSVMAVASVACRVFADLAHMEHSGSVGIKIKRGTVNDRKAHIQAEIHDPYFQAMIGPRLLNRVKRDISVDAEIGHLIEDIAKAQYVFHTCMTVRFFVAGVAATGLLLSSDLLGVGIEATNAHVVMAAATVILAVEPIVREWTTTKYTQR